jgi:hypothetical protein
MPGRSSGRAWWDLRSSCRSDSRLLIAIPFGVTLQRGQLTAPADRKQIPSLRRRSMDPSGPGAVTRPRLAGIGVCRLILRCGRTVLSCSRQVVSTRCRCARSRPASSPGSRRGRCAPAARNLVMDLEDAGSRAKYVQSGGGWQMLPIRRSQSVTPQVNQGILSRHFVPAEASAFYVLPFVLYRLMRDKRSPRDCNRGLFRVAARVRNRCSTCQRARQSRRAAPLPVETHVVVGAVCVSAEVA